MTSFDASLDAARRLARRAQDLVEQNRLSRHRHIALRLTSLPAHDAERVVMV